jgi:hypothetical protein
MGKTILLTENSKMSPSIICINPSPVQLCTPPGLGSLMYGLVFLNRKNKTIIN